MLNAQGDADKTALRAKAVLAGIWVIVAAVAVAAGGQTSPVAAQPVFEVASVKPNPADHARGSMGVRPGGRFEAANATPFLLITFAYDLGADFVEGAPAWTRTERLDVQRRRLTPQSLARTFV